MPKFLNHLDLAQNEARNIVVHKTASSGFSGAVDGQLIYDSGDLKFYDATGSPANGWQTVATGGSNTDTTYTTSVAQSGSPASNGDPFIRLTAGGSGSGNDDIQITGGTNVTVTRDDNDGLTIASTDTVDMGDGFNFGADSDISPAPNKVITEGETFTISGGGSVSTQVTAANTITITGTDTVDMGDGFIIAGDSSASPAPNGTIVEGETFTIEGSGSVSTELSAANTITITGVNTVDMGSGFTIAADSNSGSPAHDTTIVESSTLSIDGGTGISTVVSAADTIDINLAVAGDDITFANSHVADIKIAPTAAGAVGQKVKLSAGNTTAGTTNNIAGGDLELSGGQGKGNAVGGSILFKVAPAGVSGSSLNALATAMTIASDKSVTISGDLTVSGTTTTVDSTTVATGDNMLKLAKDNTAAVTDIGWYGRYMSGSPSANSFAGMAWDASANKFTIGTAIASNEPGVTIAWDAVGTLIGNIEGDVTGALTGNADTVTNATLTTALTVNTGTVTLSGDSGGSTLSIGTTASVSGTNTGDGTYGIADTNYVKIDSSDVADDEYARFTANGLESREASEVLSDIGAVAANSAITAATNTKITFDTKGLVTGSAALASADIPNNAANTTGTARGLDATGFGLLNKTFVLTDNAGTVVNENSSNSTDSAVWTITHGMGTSFYYKAEVILNSGDYDTVYVDVQRPTNTTVKLTFGSDVANGAYAVMLTRMA